MEPEVTKRRLLLLVDKLPQVVKTLPKDKVPRGMKMFLVVALPMAPLFSNLIRDEGALSLQSLMFSLENMVEAMGSDQVTDDEFLGNVVDMLTNEHSKAFAAKTTA